jgi:phospholipid-binding lipoprotein MlaA
MKNFKFILYVLIFLIISLGGCSNNKVYLVENSDPLEKINRNIFNFNKYIDNKIVMPISAAYVKKVPNAARDSITSHLNWMGLPNTIANSTMQLDFENTILASAKFMLNGLTLGFYDLDNGETDIIKKDFGSTLAKINVPEGPFLMIPFFGPKLTRDFSGFIVDRQNMANVSSTTMNDINLIEVPVSIIDKRGKLSDSIDTIYNSADPYTKMKSYYIQNRRKQVYGQKYHDSDNQNKDKEFEKLLQ